MSDSENTDVCDMADHTSLVPDGYVPSEESPSGKSTTPTPPVTPQVAVQNADAQGSNQSREARTSENKKKASADLQIKELPPIEEIKKLMPPDGLDVRDLARKLKIDQTNCFLFSELLKVLGDTGTPAWVTPFEETPSKTVINHIYEAARKPAVPRELLANQVISAKLRGDIQITWNDHTELARSVGNILPEAFYRTFYEDSATLTPFVTKHNLPKNRQRLHVVLDKKNAFQSLGQFSIAKDINRPRIERHLIWNQKRDPSSFISVFDKFSWARRRAVYHSPDGKSNRIGERIAIAEISTHGLRPVTIHADVEEIISTTEKDSFGLYKVVSSTSEIRQVQIPAWIHDDAFVDYEDASSMTIAQLEAANPEIWLSITELRHSNLRVPAAKGHSYEWLAGGFISNKRIEKIIPFDGKKLHHNETQVVIKSGNIAKCWIWTWPLSMWLLDESSSHDNGGTIRAAETCDSTADVSGLRPSDTLQEEDSEEIDEIETQSTASIANAEMSSHVTQHSILKRKPEIDESRSDVNSKRARMSPVRSFLNAPECNGKCLCCCVRADEEQVYTMAWLAYLRGGNKSRS